MFWSLPGPRRFLEKVQKDLRAGNNVVLRLPQPPPTGLESVLRSMLSEEWNWRSLEIDEERPPADILFSRLVPCATPGQVRNARTLAQSDGFEGFLIWINGLCAAVWPEWKIFLQEYQHVCRSKPEFRRSLFLIPLVGELAMHPPVAEVGLSHHIWRGVVGELDMLFFSALLLQERPIPDRQRPLMVTTVAKLAAWDPETAEVLAKAPLREILCPYPLLQQLAEARGWSLETPPSWILGTQNEVDGQEYVHSALLAVKNRKEIIKARLWSAQVSVLLPLIEEHRQALINEIGHLLGLPFQTGYGVIKDVHDLEIGHIAYRLRGIRVDPRIRRQVERLHLIRNALAHLEPLEPEVALSPELYEVIGTRCG